jgi:translocation and assembly module TamB
MAEPTAPPTPPPAARQHGGPLRSVRQLLTPVLWILLLLALLTGALVGAASWLLRGEAGTAWLLQRLPGVQASGVQGALLSDSFAVQRLHIEGGSAFKSLTLEGLQAQGLVWHWRPHAAAWVGVEVQSLKARRAEWHGSSTHHGPPASIAVPLQALLARVEVAELVIDALHPWRNVVASGEVGADAGQLHRIDSLRYDWDTTHIEAVGQIQTHKPLTLSVKGELRPGSAQASPWNATLTAQGPLEAFTTQTTLRGPASAGHAAPSLDLNAGIRPFAPWPLANLKASVQALDLAALTSLAPQTRLSGTADVVTSAANAPINADIQLSNAAPGRWDQQRLPIKQLALALRGSAQHREKVEITRFELALADTAQDAGRWRGTGLWDASALKLDSQLVELRPQHLDARVARLVASGPLTATLRGLGSPARWLDGAAATANPAPKDSLTLELLGTLDGRLDATPQALRVQLDGSFSSQRLELRQFRASAGNALAQGRAEASVGTSGGWNVKSDGSLSDVDPVQWWPGSDNSAWRQGPHRVSGSWQLDLKLPALKRLNSSLDKGLNWLPWAQTISGSGQVRVQDSQLAGVPLQLDLTLANSPGTPAPSSLRGELRLGGNRLNIEGRGDPAGSGAADRWQADLKADAVAALAPITRLWPELAEWAPRDGSAQAQLQGAGRWPDIRSEGQAQLERLRLGELQLQTGTLVWKLDTASDQPLNVQTQLGGLRLERQQIDQLQAEVQGTLRQHVMRAQVALPLKPPEWTETVLGLQPRSGTRAALRAEGSWAGDGSGGGAWRGRIAEIGVGAWDGSAPAVANVATTQTSSQTTTPRGWFEAKDLRVELQFSPRGGLVDLRAEAGQARIAEALKLRWEAVHLDNRGPRANFALRAELEPFQAAPVLARLQPSMGWAGDLQLAANVDVKAGERFDADIVFERRSGDLISDDVAGRHSLGLTGLRVALAAHDGEWLLTQALAGRTLGDVNGKLKLRLPAVQRWPDAQTTLEGNIEARATDIGIWSAWVPPGWRLSGSLTTNASVAGRIGAPDYSGKVQGANLGVRNLLQGVDVSGGDVVVTLKGASAQIERFALRGGDGLIEVSGQADLGPSPSARLQLQAQRFRVLGRVDRQLTASGKATLQLATDSTKLDGEIKVDEGLFDVSRSDAPSLDEDVVLRSTEANPSSGPNPATANGREPNDTGTPKPSRRSTQMNVQIDLGEKLRVRGRGLDTLLGGQLRLSTPQNKLAMHGIVRAVGGTYAAYAQKLDIDRGILSFSGPPDNPALDILALRPNIDARVGVAIGGSFVIPRVRLYSDPEMSDTDKLSWLVLGRPSDGLGRADSALLQRAAVALLAGEGEAPTDAFLRTIGLDELSLRQSDGEVRETVISLGKQLSRRWYLGYERGVNATTGTWQLIYRIAQRFTLRAQSGADNSLDVIWVWRVGETSPLPINLPKLPSLLPMRKSAPAAGAASANSP